MDRRNFFKGMFGAAIVASMPKIVVDQIEKVPIEEITPVPVLEKPKYVMYHLGEQCMYLYDNDKLIAGSTLFNLSFRREYLNMMDSSYLDSYPPEFRMGRPEWSVTAEQLRWFNHKRGLDYFTNEKPLQCVIYNKGVVIKGNVYITQCTLTCGMETFIQEDVTLQGTGELIIDINE
jgi:hypothetical protein